MSLIPKSVKMYLSTRSLFAKKALSVFLVLFLCLAVCFGQLVSVQLFNGYATAQAAIASRTVTKVIRAQRGRILDTNGSVIVQSVERYNIIADPQLAQSFVPIDCTAKTKSYCHQINGKEVGTKGAAAVARLLAPLLGMDAKELGAKLSVAGQYTVLKKNVTPEVKRKIDKLNLGGIITGEVSNERTYSNEIVLPALLGVVNGEGVGVTGIEQTENKVLSGTNGYKKYQVGGTGVEIPGTEVSSKDAVNGSDVTLTIDADVDWYVKQSLQKAKSAYKADWALAVVQDVKTGNIVAMEDSDDFVAGSSEAALNTPRVVSQTFEPGSIGKAFSVAGMLQTGSRSLTDKFTVADQITKEGQKYKDAENHSAEHWTLAGILENSSNVGMIMAGENFGNKQRYEFLKKFGIGVDTVGIPGESQGLLSNYSQWDVRTQQVVLFGQGYATNALQLTNAMATIANKGVKVKQNYIKSITDSDGHTTDVTNSESTRVLDENVAQQMVKALEASGSLYSKFAGVDGYRVAAKSGTAEVADGKGGLTSRISDWSGIIPADNPRFVVTVVMKNPQGTFGGLTAGPVFKEIASFLMQKYEVPQSAADPNPVTTKW
ncbi:MAG: penicillin-binding protein 2 [Bifidobacteriaceae bacterium]|nr:penicillin-binding protein 2 [Bifidobacteriaceae bacterium]